MMDTMDTLTAWLRDHDIHEVTIWEPRIVGRLARIAWLDPATGQRQTVRALPAVHLMADCPTVTRARDRDGQAPMRTVPLDQLDALAREPGRVICGKCEPRFLTEKRRPFEGTLRIEGPVAICGDCRFTAALKGTWSVEDGVLTWRAAADPQPRRTGPDELRRERPRRQRRPHRRRRCAAQR